MKKSVLFSVFLSVIITITFAFSTLIETGVLRFAHEDNGDASLFCDHIFSTITTVSSATCTEEGHGYRECTKCHIKKEVTTPKTAHTVDGWTVTVEPTCAKAGEAYGRCTSCWQVVTKTLAKRGHSPKATWTIIKAPTLTETGLKGIECEVCGEFLCTVTMPKLSEPVDPVDPVDPIDPVDPVDPSNPSHTHTYDGAFTIDTAATCTTGGQKSRHCTHTNCTARTDVTVIPATGHNYGAGKVILKATCTAGEVKQFKCTNAGCTHSYTETGTALGHNFGDFTTERQATCTESGVKARHCSRCEARKDVTVITALGHNFEKNFTIDFEPNCLSDGQMSRHCTRCEEATEITVIEHDADMHDPIESTIIYIKATCTTGGYMEYECRYCHQAVRILCENELGHDDNFLTGGICGRCGAMGTGYDDLGHDCARHGHVFSTVGVCVYCGYGYDETTGTIIGVTDPSGSQTGGASGGQTTCSHAHTTTETTRIFHLDGQEGLLDEQYCYANCTHHTCSDCGKEWWDNYVYTSHTFAGGTCTNCGFSKMGCNHDHVEIIDLPQGCVTIHHGECTDCGATTDVTSGSHGTIIVDKNGKKYCLACGWIFEMKV